MQKPNGRVKVLGDKVGSMTFQETSRSIDSGKYGLPAMDTHTVGSGKLLGHDFNHEQHLPLT